MNFCQRFYTSGSGRLAALTACFNGSDVSLFCRANVKQVGVHSVHTSTPGITNLTDVLNKVSFNLWIKSTGTVALLLHDWL